LLIIKKIVSHTYPLEKKKERGAVVNNTGASLPLFYMRKPLTPTYYYVSQWPFVACILH